MIPILQLRDIDWRRMIRDADGHELAQVIQFTNEVIAERECAQRPKKKVRY